MASPFLTSELDGDECTASLRSFFTTEERAPGTHWIGGWAIPRAGFDAVQEKKFLAPAVNRTPAAMKIYGIVNM
jgi:hypothetical protein